MGLSGEVSLVSLWFIMFLSDANASEDEVVPRKVKCGCVGAMLSFPPVPSVVRKRRSNQTSFRLPCWSSFQSVWVVHRPLMGLLGCPVLFCFSSKSLLLHMDS